MEAVFFSEKTVEILAAYAAQFAIETPMYLPHFAVGIQTRVFTLICCTLIWCTLIWCTLIWCTLICYLNLV